MRTIPDTVAISDLCAHPSSHINFCRIIPQTVAARTKTWRISFVKLLLSVLLTSKVGAAFPQTTHSTSTPVTGGTNSGDLYAQSMRYLGFNATAIEQIDRARGIELLRKSAEMGNIDAQAFVGMVSREGNYGFPQNTVLALYFLEAAAAAGHAGAQQSLAEMNLIGEGLPKNPVKASQLFSSAAKQGLNPSVLKLAHLYEVGMGVPANGERAIALYKRAAVAGYIPAQYELARVFAQGKIAKTDLVLSYAWTNVAASIGSESDRTLNADVIEQALKLRDLVGAPQMMTLEQRQLAQRLSAEWSPGSDISRVQTAGRTKR